MLVAVVHFIDGHTGTKRSPNCSHPPEAKNICKHVVAAAKLRLGMLLNFVTTIANANTLSAVVATGNDSAVMFHTGHPVV